MDAPRREFDWISFLLYFLLGAIPGAFAGFYIWARLYDRPTGQFDKGWEGAIFIAAGAILFGLASGWLRDKLWTK